MKPQRWRLSLVSTAHPPTHQLAPTMSKPTSAGIEREQVATIRLQIHSVDQLLNPENSPFCGPRLDPMAGERILKLALGLPKAASFTVEFKVP